MSKLEKLIDEFCPDGVEYVKLDKDIVDFKRGKTITAKEAKEGDIPVISGGLNPAYYHNESNRDGVTIVVAGSGAYAGYISYWEKPIFVSDAFSIEPKSDLDKKYLYYCLKNLQDDIYATKKGFGVPHVHASSLSKLEIPLPHIKIQQEIVRILDDYSENYNELQSKLEKELQLRKEEYEYYLNSLLTFQYEDNNVKWKCIGKVAKRNKGINITAQKMRELNVDGGNIRIFAGGYTVVDVRESDIPEANIINSPSIIVKSRGSNINFAYYDKPFTHKNEMWSYSDFQEGVNIRYVYYYLVNHTDEFQKIAEANAVKIPQLSIKDMDEYKVPIPLPDDQQRIVTLLDKYTSAYTELLEKIELEIKIRKEEYEYYRDKLLTFKRKVV